MRHRSVVGFSSVLVVLTSAGVSQAQAPPHQKPGLWQTDMTQAGSNFSMKMCLDEATEARNSVFSAAARKNGKCKNVQLTHNLDGSWTSVSTCEFQPGVVRTSRADVRGDFNSKITMTMRSPPTAPPEASFTSTYLGPCAAGQKGGDMIMSDGSVIKSQAMTGR